MSRTKRIGTRAAALLSVTLLSMSAFADDVVVTQPIPAAPAPVQATPVPPVGTTRTTAAYYPAQPRTVESERTVSTSPNPTFLRLGLTTFGLTYASSIVAGAVSGRDSDKNLFIPVVGPWIDLNDRGCASRPCGDNEGLAKAMIITSGIVQGAGLLLTIGSFFIPSKTTTEEKTTTSKLKPTFKVAPVSYGGGAGLGALGTF